MCFPSIICAVNPTDYLCFPISQSLTIGGKTKVDANTTATAMLDQKGSLSTCISHQLRSFAKINLVTTWNLPAVARTGFGVSLTLGETDE
jgi:hypothetical protein